MPVKKWCKDKIGWNEDAASNKVLQAIGTFILVDFTWIFFRAPGTKDAIQIIQSMLKVKNFQIFFDESLYNLGLDRSNFVVLIIAIILLFIVDICHDKNIRIWDWLQSQNLWFRWLVYILLFESILLFGIWGVGYDKVAFLYFQF